MRVRDRREVLEDVTESSADPEGWRAVGGRRANGVGEDLYLGHPTDGVHAGAPTDPEDLFRDLMDAVDSPAFGPMQFDPRWPTRPGRGTLWHLRRRRTAPRRRTRRPRRERRNRARVPVTRVAAGRGLIGRGAVVAP